MPLTGEFATRLRTHSRELREKLGRAVAHPRVSRTVRQMRVLRRTWGGLFEHLPKGLYPRTILIVVLPIVILQSVVAYVFIERQLQNVTEKLSDAVTRDIAAIIEVIETYPQDERFSQVEQLSGDALGLSISVLPPEPLPAPAPKPFFSILDSTLSDKIRERINRPFWIDTVGNSDMVEIRISLKDHVLRIFAPRSRTLPSNQHIFIVWMVGTSLVLIAIALLFLRNQIKPILVLAEAAENFGKGRPVRSFRPRGAREVRQASQAFLDMRERIERQIEQRTTMLSGVSHDLRTILTRLTLGLAMLDETPETDALRGDVVEMRHMLEDYLAFAKGDAGEASEGVDVPALLEDLAENARRSGDRVSVSFEGAPQVLVRATPFRRCLANLIGNAGKYADTVEVRGRHLDGWLTITIDDDGPGIPEEELETVFRPFYRLDRARNVDAGGTGLGLAIARDIARSHGGDIALGESSLGGLSAVLRIPA